LNQKYQNTLSSLVETTGKLLETTNKLHAEFNRYTRLYNIPRSPMQHKMCGYSIQPPSSAAAISGSHPITNTVIESGPGTKQAANELEPEESE
jgi:hypothetical protein